MDKTKPIRVIRSFAEFWLVCCVIVALVEHFARHHHWEHSIERAALYALVPGIIGGLVEMFRKDA